MPKRANASTAKLQAELKKRRPFESSAEELHLNLLRTADQIELRLARLFRKYQLTTSQYNILRILRGEGSPLPILEVAARTITVVPGITGLVDRLESAQLVERQRSTEDRRVINVAITPLGLERLAQIDAPLARLHKELAAGLSASAQKELSSSLEAHRAGFPPLTEEASAG